MYVCAEILDISKLLMNRKYCDGLKRVYGRRVAFIYTDTESFLLYIKTEDLNKQLIENKVHELFD